MDLKSLIELKPNPNIPNFRPGDTVRVQARVVEGERQRLQAFEGVVIRIRRAAISSSFTVRRVSHGVGVERTFLYYSPLIEKVQVVRVGRVRRAKLYYLRRRLGRAARIRAGARARFEELTAAPAYEEEHEEELEEVSEEVEEGEAAEETGEGEEVEEVEAEEEEKEAAAEEPAAGEPEEPAAESAEEDKKKAE